MQFPLGKYDCKTKSRRALVGKSVAIPSNVTFGAHRSSESRW